MKVFLTLLFLMTSTSVFSEQMGESQAVNCDQSIHLGRFQTEKTREISSIEDESEEQEVEFEAKTLSK
ncbi:MAG: hypothetical protein ACO20H_00240 [Bacteriovoracaceae bacterium]